MLKIDIKYEDSEVQRELKRMMKQARNTKPLMREIGDIVKTSVKKNFEVGGRYKKKGSIEGGSKKWQRWAVATILSAPKNKILTKKGRFRIPFKRGLKNSKRKILVGKGRGGGRLMGSINRKATRGQVEIGPDNIKYAAIHQFGGKAGRGLRVNIPARPYLVIQSEDKTEILAAVKRHLEKG